MLLSMCYQSWTGCSFFAMYRTLQLNGEDHRTKIAKTKNSRCIDNCSYRSNCLSYDISHWKLLFTISSFRCPCCTLFMYPQVTTSITYFWESFLRVVTKLRLNVFACWYELFSSLFPTVCPAPFAYPFKIIPVQWKNTCL